MSDSSVSPEYRELHEFHCRCVEIREALLRDGGLDLKSEAATELLGRYWELAHLTSELMLCLNFLHGCPYWAPTLDTY